MNSKNGLMVTFWMGLLIVSLMLPACGKSQGDGKNAGGAPEVAVVTLKTERVPITTELPARTATYMIAEVRPQVTGIIQKRLFAEGTDVKAGDVLYQIDPATYEAAYAQAKATLARSEANIVSIRTRSERYKELVAINAVSRQEYDDVLAALKQAEADIAAGKAGVETARINLAYTKVTAPISGRTGKSNVTVGALVTANQPTPLTVVQQLDPIYVDATQSSAELLRIRKNIAVGRIKGDGPDRARVKLLLEDGAPYPLEGALKFSDVTVDASTGSFILRMVFPNPKNVLLPGMYVRALVLEGVAERAILVPQQSISRDPKGNPGVLIVDKEGKVQPRAISIIDRAVGDKWLVASGLAVGDQVIVEGLQKVRPGVSVKVVPFDGGRKEGPESPKKSETPAKAK
jgi:membrane fusion protein, multidrug efflux system